MKDSARGGQKHLMSVRRYSEDREFSDKFLPQLGVLLATAFVGTQAADWVRDTRHATDLVLTTDKLESLTAAAKTVSAACRVRRPYWPISEFTISEDRIPPSPGLTELQKILSGNGPSYLVYAVATTPGELRSWFVGDLKVFARWYAEGGRGERKLKVNDYPQQWFSVYKRNRLPSDFEVAASRRSEPVMYRSGIFRDEDGLRPILACRTVPDYGIWDWYGRRAWRREIGVCPACGSTVLRDGKSELSGMLVEHGWEPVDCLCHHAPIPARTC